VEGKATVAADFTNIVKIAVLSASGGVARVHIDATLGAFAACTMHYAMDRSKAGHIRQSVDDVADASRRPCIMLALAAYARAWPRTVDRERDRVRAVTVDHVRA
jgi:hypothetical protein